jgi:TRAP-type mannitol/chloroaromatic compound transport system permease small subunit
MITVLIIVVWTIVSIWYTTQNLGNKTGTSSRWEWIVVIPVLLIAYMFASITKLIKKCKQIRG